MEKDSGLYNQNKGYAGQEKKDLMNDNPIAKDASGGRGGSWMSKHSQSKMGGSPLMDKGHGGAKFSENHLSSGKHKSDLPGSAAMMVSPLNKQGENDKDDESISAKIGAKGSNISNKDRRDESLGDYGTRTK